MHDDRELSRDGDLGFTEPVALNVRKPGLQLSDIVRKRVDLGTGSNLLDRAKRSSPEAA